MADRRYSAGIVTAYGAAVRGGYAGTYAQFCQDQAEFAQNARLVAQYADQASGSKTSAETAAQAAAASAQEAADALADAQQCVDDAEGHAEDAADRVADAEAYAIGRRHGADVGSTDVAYHNNAKYYAEQAASHETAAAGSATAAAGSASAAAASATAAEEVLESIPEDYTEMGEAVTDLKSAINTLTVPLAVGYYIGMTGNPTGPSDSFSISELCPFSQNDKFELFDFNNSSWKAYCYGYAFYDENKEMIPDSGNGDFDGHFSSDSVTIPQGTCYVRFSTRTQFSPNAYVVINYINGALANLKRTIDAEINGAINTLTVPLAVGYYIGMTGNPTGPSDSFSISELCPFSQNDKFELFDFNNSSWKAYCYGYAFYDENKEMIPDSGNGDFDGHFSSDSVTIPQGTCYVRFSTRTQFSPNAYVVINYINGALANLKRTIDAEINGAINTIDTEINQLSDRTESAFDDISNNAFVNEFKGFDTSVEGVGSTTFRAFATRYSFTGEVDKVSVYARCSGASATINVEIAIWDGSFTSVLASKTVAVQSNSAMQWVDAVFDSPVQLSGNFYVSIKAATGNVASTPNETTSNCTAMPSGSTDTNKYIPSSESTDIWSYCGNNYCLDVILYRNGRELKHNIPTIIYVGNQNGCDYTTIQDAIDSIKDDSPSKPYTIVILPGNYERFKLRGATYQTPRWISLFGYDSNTTIVFDNLGDYSYPPAEIQTNGTIQGISFINMTDEEHHTQTQGRTFAYAVHVDFGSCKVKFINCKFVSNAGAAVGIGTCKDCDFTFENCTFISECDGTFGDVGHGGLFVHTGLADNQTNQGLTVRNSISYAPHQQYGARFAVISGYTGGTYNYNFQNFGAFGNNGADVSLQDPNNNLLGEYNFNNLPLLLNTV